MLENRDPRPSARSLYDDALPVSTALDDLDDWRLLPGEVAGRVWDSRIHGFGGPRRHEAFVAPPSIPGFDDA